MLDTYRRNEQQTQEDFFKQNIYLSLYCKGSKRVTQCLRVRGSWRPNITEIFWPQTYGRQRCVFLVLQGCSTGGPGPTLLDVIFLYCILSASSLDSNLSGPQAPSAWCGFPYHISSPTVCNSTGWNSTQLSAFCSIHRPYITFKLPRRNMETPPRLRNFFRYLAIGMCHFCYLWNGLCDRHRAEITVMQFTGHSLPVHQSMSVSWALPCPISSANFRPRDFLS